MLRASEVRRLALDCGFELAGVAAAAPVPESSYFLDWVAAGFAGKMGYLTDRRAQLRLDPRSLLPSARSIVSVAKLYNTSGPRTVAADAGSAWISRYAWGTADYHDVLRRGLEDLVQRMEAAGGAFEYKICVDTAPLLERSYARLAGLGWIGRNSCLINQQQGSYLFLGEILTSLDLEPGTPAPDRCGSCTRCIDACPTRALIPFEGNAGSGYALDASRCISYLTIELKGPSPEDTRSATGNHVFGCDICQDVCPWNAKAPETADAAFTSTHVNPRLEDLSALGPGEFRERFGNTPLSRARYSGFLRNVATAMGNSGERRFLAPLQILAGSPAAEVAEHARWALSKLEGSYEETPQPDGVP